MFMVPHSKIENLGIFQDISETNTSYDLPIYVTPHFIKNGKELTIEDDIEILMNGGTPYQGFLKTPEEVANTNAKSVNWFYLNLKHITTIYSRADRTYSGPMIFNRQPQELYGGEVSPDYPSQYLWSLPFRIFVKDEKLNKIFFTEAYKICHGKNKLYPIYLKNNNYDKYTTYLFNFLSKIFTDDLITSGSLKELCKYFGLFKNNGIEYLYNSYWSCDAIQLPIDLNNLKIYNNIYDIPNFNREEFNNTKITEYTKINSEDYSTHNMLFHWGNSLMPDFLKDKIIGVTPEKGLPLFNVLDLAKNGYIATKMGDSFFAGHDIPFGLTFSKTILDIPFCVIKFRKTFSSYSVSTVNNLPLNSNSSFYSDKNFLSFKEFMYKNPITGEIYSLFGFKGNDRNLVIDKTIKGYAPNSTDSDQLIVSNIFLKPLIINGDYGLSAIIMKKPGRYEFTGSYDTERPDIDYKPKGVNNSINTSYSIWDNKIEIFAKDAEVYRTPKNLNYIYKDNPDTEIQHKINLDPLNNLTNTFALFDRVPKNIIDNYQEWVETTDTRNDFKCDGFRDIEVYRWLSHIPMQFYENYDTTYQLNKEIREIEQTNKLVDFTMKYISNQLANCRIYLVDTKYFNVIGHSEWYKTLLPFRCIFFPIEDMWLYTADNKIDKLNPKYFGDNNEFVYDIQKFTKFCVKHYSKVFEVLWDTKKENNTDFKITEGKTIKYSFCNAPIDYYATIFAPYTNGIISLYNLELNTEIK